MDRPIFTKHQAYAVLGLRDTASMDEVKAARNILIKKLHPDEHIDAAPGKIEDLKKRLVQVQLAYNAIKSGNFIPEARSESNNQAGQESYHTSQDASAERSDTRQSQKTDYSNYTGYTEPFAAERESAKKKHFRRKNSKSYDASSGTVMSGSSSSPATIFGTVLHLVNMLLSAGIVYFVIIAFMNGIMLERKILVYYNIALFIASVITGWIYLAGAPSKRIPIVSTIMYPFTELASDILDTIALKFLNILSVAFFAFFVFWFIFHSAAVSIYIILSVYAVIVNALHVFAEAGQSTFKTSIDYEDIQKAKRKRNLP